MTEVKCPWTKCRHNRGGKHSYGGGSKGTDSIEIIIDDEGVASCSGFEAREEPKPPSPSHKTPPEETIREIPKE